MSADKPLLLILTPIGRYQEPLNREALDNLSASQLFDMVYLTVIGVSEVARARNMLCFKALEAMRQLEEQERKIDAVLWLDSDMVFWPSTVMAHYRLLKLGVFDAISGAYSNRFDGRMAASFSLDVKEPMTIDYEGDTYKFTPVMAGMGALMLDPSCFFSYLHICQKNDKAKEIFACWPTIETSKDEGVVMVSEDYNFCRRLFMYTNAMVYLTRSLQYGHIAQKVLVPKLEESA